MKQNSIPLLQYIVFLEERISRAKKQGKDTTTLQRNRADALQQIDALSRSSPNPKNKFQAVTEQI